MIVICDLVRPLLVGVLLMFSVNMQADSDGTETSAGSHQPKLAVLASIKPLALMARDVAGGHVDVDVLLSAGQTPHDFAFKVSDRQRLERADVLLWVGPGLEPYLKNLAEQRSSLSMAEVIPDHVNAAEHEHSSNPASQGHHHGDRHLWLNPEHGAAMLLAIADTLAALDPPQAELYRQRAQQQAELLRSLRAKTGPGRPYAVVHEAYNHLLEYFHYPQPLVLTPTPEISPGARQLWQVSQSLKPGSCVLTESGRPKKWVSSFIERYDFTALEADIMGFNSDVSTYYKLVQGVVGVFDQCALEPAVED